MGSSTGGTSGIGELCPRRVQEWRTDMWCHVFAISTLCLVCGAILLATRIRRELDFYICSIGNNKTNFLFLPLL